MRKKVWLPSVSVVVWVLHWQLNAADYRVFVHQKGQHWLPFFYVIGLMDNGLFCSCRTCSYPLSVPVQRMRIAGIGVGRLIPAGNLKTGAVGAFQNLCRLIPLTVIHKVLILQIAAR